MKITIRKNVFETNSSSTHSLVISKVNRNYDYDNLPVENGVLKIKFGEFGWGPKVLRNPIEKLSYLITDRCKLNHYSLDEKSWCEITDLVFEDENIQEILKTLKRCRPDIEEIVFKKASRYYPIGYVDHESCGTSYEKDLSIEDIIFSNKVIIIIDNDNTGHYKDYFTSWDGKAPKKDIEKLFKE